MAAAALVDTCRDFPAFRAPGGSHATTCGAVAHVAGHGHGHGTHGVRVTQGVVVHHVVHVVVVDVGLQLVQQAFEILLLEAQAVAGAFKLRTVHAAPGVTRLGITGSHAGFQHGVGIRRPAEGHVGVPLVPCRRHALAIAITIVVGLGTVGGKARIAEGIAGHRIQHLVIASLAATQQAGIDTHAGLVEIGNLALEAHRAGRGATAPQHRLRALDHGQAVIGFWRDIGHRIVHARRAGTTHRAVIRQQIQARTEHAAQHRITIGATTAQHREAGNRLQVIRAIAGGYGLTRQLGIGDEGHGHAGRNAGDDQRIQVDHTLVEHDRIRSTGAACSQGTEGREKRDCQC